MSLHSPQTLSSSTFAAFPCPFRPPICIGPRCAPWTHKQHSSQLPARPPSQVCSLFQPNWAPLKGPEGDARAREVLWAYCARRYSELRGLGTSVHQNRRHTGSTGRSEVFMVCGEFFLCGSAMPATGVCAGIPWMVDEALGMRVSRRYVVAAAASLFGARGPVSNSSTASQRLYDAFEQWFSG